MVKRDLYRYISDFKKSGVIILDGPSGSGKTQLLYKLKELSNLKVEILTSEKISDTVREAILTNKNTGEIAESFDCDVLCLEDMDMLRGKQRTLEKISHIVNLIAPEKIVIITGIDLMERVCDFVESLDFLEYILF